MQKKCTMKLYNTLIITFLISFFLISCDQVSELNESKKMEGIFLADEENTIPFTIGKLEFIGSKVSVYYNPTSSTSVFSANYKIEGDVLYIENVPQIGDIRFDIKDEDTFQGHGTLIADKKYYRITNEQNQVLLEHGRNQKEALNKWLKKDESGIKSLKSIINNSSKSNIEEEEQKRQTANDSI
jgi:hypothetical protein